jgi:hypothetical protein
LTGVDFILPAFFFFGVAAVADRGMRKQSNADLTVYAPLFWCRRDPFGMRHRPKTVRMGICRHVGE